MQIYVYSLRCAVGSYDVGSTRCSLETRIGQHNAGTFGGYTGERPVELTGAFAAERRIKGWSRAKKEALIRGDDEALRLRVRRQS